MTVPAIWVLNLTTFKVFMEVLRRSAQATEAEKTSVRTPALPKRNRSFRTCFLAHADLHWLSQRSHLFAESPQCKTEIF